MSDALAIVDGQISSLKDATIPFLDRGFLFGEAVYEAMLAESGHPFGRELHLARLLRSAEGAGICLEGLPMRVGAAVDALLNAFGPAPCLLYLHVTGGAAPRDHVPPTPAPTPLVAGFLRAFDLGAMRARREEGIEGITAPDLRWSGATYKTAQLLPNVLARRAAHQRGGGEAILVDAAGRYLEGASSNVFCALVDGTLTTPPTTANILPGITRRQLIDAFGVDRVEERVLEPAEHDRIAELFITSSTRFALPVVRLDGRPVGDGRVGPVATEANRLLDALFRSETGG